MLYSVLGEDEVDKDGIVGRNGRLHFGLHEAEGERPQCIGASGILCAFLALF
jgi:tetrahydromethanopterin S-methyltransferase subunit F